MSIYRRTDDITFCSNQKCKRKTCSRHLDNRIHKDRPYSVADYENTKLCPIVYDDFDVDNFSPLPTRLDRNDLRRYEEIRGMRDAGVTLSEIGKKYGVSRQRIHQILKWKGRK